MANVLGVLGSSATVGKSNLSDVFQVCQGA